MSTPTTIAASFSPYVSHLDDDQACRDELLKTNKIVTTLSKKMIFALHRGAFQDCAKLQHQALSELSGMPVKAVYRWGGSAISGAIQEYIEAILFKDYLQQRQQPQNPQNQEEKQYFLLGFEETVAHIPFGDIVVPIEDYLLGVLDFTGELMRYGITHSTGTTAREAIEMLRTIAVYMDDIAPYAEHGIKSFPGKHKVLRESLRKIEKQVYTDVLKKNNGQLLRPQIQEPIDRPSKRLCQEQDMEPEQIII